MTFLQWLKTFRWDAYGWLAIIGIGAYWEIMGAIYKDRTTFTDLVRTTVPTEIRLLIFMVLIWHFCMGPGNANGPKWW
jgi:hypothetical protein